MSSTTLAMKRRRRLIRNPVIKIDTIRKEMKKVATNMAETKIIYGGDNQALATGTTTGAVLAWGGFTIVKLSYIEPGVASYQRIGNKIKVQRLRAVVDCYNQTAASNNSVVRCVIVRDKEPIDNADIAAVTEVFPTMTIVQRVVSAPCCKIVAAGAMSVSVDNPRFEILYDKVKPVEKIGDAGKDRAIFRINKKINRTCQYHGGASVNDKGQIYMFLMTDETDNILVNYTYRVSYKDM